MVTNYTIPSTKVCSDEGCIADNQRCCSSANHELHIDTSAFQAGFDMERYNVRDGSRNIIFVG